MMGKGSDAIASSSSLLCDNGLSHCGVNIYIQIYRYMHVCNMIHLYIKKGIGCWIEMKKECCE